MQTTDQDTQRFLEGLWFRWGEVLVQRVCALYGLDELQKEAVESVVLRPNDWVVRVLPSLADSPESVG